MDIISAYREVGSYRGAAVVAGTTPKTVKRVMARHEGGGGAPPRWSGPVTMTMWPGWWLPGSAAGRAARRSASGE